MPLPWHPFELCRTSLLKAQARADHEILHRARDEHLTRSGASADASPMCTAIPAMSPSRSSYSPVWTPARTSRPSGRTRSVIEADALHGAARAVEGGQEAVAQLLDLPAAEAGQLSAHELVVALQDPAPIEVAGRGGALGRADDVGEQH